MATIIDVDKVTQAFDYLSETDKGRNALAQLHNALNSFQKEIQPTVNRGEFIYICRGLMDGLNVHEQPPAAEVSGYNYSQIPAALFANQPGAVTHAQLGNNAVVSGLSRVNLSGFNIRFVA
ncbi:MAG TPA: hypothetical protein VKV26_13170 [Dehalococcoidia bacterium]|nr:hypothetical protein [Dehalococcoidia bacterium]